MGIKQSSGQSPATYVDFKGDSGTFVIRSKQADGTYSNQVLPPNTFIDGRLTKLTYRSTVNQQNNSTIETLTAHIVDDEGARTAINFGANSLYGVKFLGRLNAAALGEPLVVRGGMTKAGDKIGDYTVTKGSPWLSVSQNNVSLKPDFGAGLTELPEIKTVTDAAGKPIIVNGQPLKDLSEIQRIGGELFAGINARLGVTEAQEEGSAEAPAPTP